MIPTPAERARLRKLRKEKNNIPSVNNIPCVDNISSTDNLDKYLREEKDLFGNVYHAICQNDINEARELIKFPADKLAEKFDYYWGIVRLPSLNEASKIIIDYCLPFFKKLPMDKEWVEYIISKEKFYDINPFGSMLLARLASSAMNDRKLYDYPLLLIVQRGKLESMTNTHESLASCNRCLRKDIIDRYHYQYQHVCIDCSQELQS